MRTTLDLPDPLYRRLKLQAAREGKTLKELVTRFLEEALSHQASGGARSLPLVPARGRRIPTMRSADLWELLEDGPS
ncbi:MAG: hypothetical protein NZN28_07935 [Meiothermus sp.]|uniref:hypothetical protein n=1 Tax=Meiothermus sp. TaxID=1955249 RepID=UPI0025E2A713|nr:hypothetical protein [Meiothermus sp.]MCS7068541.1 hypothetical protein [Meiothermus sp.]